MTFTSNNHPNDKFFAALLLGCILCIAAFFILLSSSCKSTEKKQAKLYGKFDKLKRKADADSVLKVVPSKWSLDNFPIKLSGTKTVYLPSKKIITHDTVTTINIKKDTTYITKYVTKYSHSVDTLRTTDTILDNRPLTQLQTDYRALDAKLIQSTTRELLATETKNKQRGKLLWSIGLNILLILLIIAHFLRRFGILN
jgi:regulator of protease activity HflC (stomatin/prohibitin superfamily)